jgi:hypothetical protein
LIKEWAEMEEAELEALAASFKFQKCSKKERLDNVLTAHRGVDR